MNQFEETELTKLVLKALSDGVLLFNKFMVDNNVDENHWWHARKAKYQELYDRINNNKLDVRLVSRED